MKHLSELASLKLPKGQYAIFGSGPIAIRNIRESNDIDVIVKKDLWNELVDKYPESLYDNPVVIKIGNIEIYKDWPNMSDKIDEIIENADLIMDYPFVQLKYVIEWKTQSGRDKDIRDLELIRQYNQNHKDAASNI